MAAQTIYNFPSYTTVSGTDTDTYLPSNGASINTKGANTITCYTQRTAETGTCTFQVFAEFLYEPTNTWRTWLDFNNATQIQGVSMANSALNDSAPYYQILHVQTMPLAVDADYVVTLNTVHKLYQANIPPRVRFRVRNGGTTVTNTFSAYVVLGGYGM